MIGAILDHLWQSTAVALGIGVLTIMFRNNSAGVRHTMWFVASVKFLLPFSLLASLGHTLFIHPATDSTIRMFASVKAVTAPFTVGVPVLTRPEPHISPWIVMALTVWALGFIALVAFWLMEWALLAAISKAARLAPLDMPMSAPVPVRITSELLEPGLFGIVRPVILLPHAMIGRLARPEIDAILAHELCHLRRRDNLLSLIHMLVEAAFWFHPLVWFIGARLAAESEQACDESVLDTGNKPLDYARTILTVCRLTVRSRLPCTSGVSGADLDRRITAIMIQRRIDDVDPNKILLLIGLGLFALIVPLLTGGLVGTPRAHALRSQILETVQQAVRNEAPRDRSRVVGRRWVRHYATLSSPPEMMVAAPRIQTDTTLIILPAPQLAPDDVQTAAGAADEPICRPPQQLPDSRLMGPRVCLPKQTWDRYKAQNLVLMPDGRTLLKSYEHTHACLVVATGASNAGNWTTTCP